MGTDANTQIWLGFRVADRGELSNVLAELPEELYDDLQERGQIVMNGLEFKIFNHADMPTNQSASGLNLWIRDGATAPP